MITEEASKIIDYMKRIYAFEVFYDLPKPKKNSDPIGKFRYDGTVHLAPSATVHTLLHEIGHVQDKKQWNKQACWLFIEVGVPIILIIILTACLHAGFFMYLGEELSWFLFWYFILFKRASKRAEMRAEEFALESFRLLVYKSVVDADSLWKRVRDEKRV